VLTVINIEPSLQILTALADNTGYEFTVIVVLAVFEQPDVVPVTVYIVFVVGDRVIVGEVVLVLHK
jgi:hypothetical protein